MLQGRNAKAGVSSNWWEGAIQHSIGISLQVVVHTLPFMNRCNRRRRGKPTQPRTTVLRNFSIWLLRARPEDSVTGCGGSHHTDASQSALACIMSAAKMCWCQAEQRTRPAEVAKFHIRMLNVSRPARLMHNHRAGEEADGACTRLLQAWSERRRCASKQTAQKTQVIEAWTLQPDGQRTLGVSKGAWTPCSAGIILFAIVRCWLCSTAR
jgi:hypothetical protein